MNTLTWMHTRKNTPMSVTGPRGSLLVRVMMVRQVYPNHQFQIDGVAV